MRIGPVKPLHIFAVVVIIGVGLAVWIPAQPSPDTQGKYHVSEAVTILAKIGRRAEDYYEENGRMPDVTELTDVEVSGEFVADVRGSNPYFATMKSSGVYGPVAGKTIGWVFDTRSLTWDKCTQGTVSIRFKPVGCRK